MNYKYQVEKDDEYRFLNGKVFQWQRAMNLSKIKKEQANKLPWAQGSKTSQETTIHNKKIPKQQ